MHRIIDSFPRIEKLKKNNSSFVSQRGWRPGLTILVLLFIENCMKYYVFFSGWLRTGSNPADSDFIKKPKYLLGTMLFYTYSIFIYFYVLDSIKKLIWKLAYGCHKYIQITLMVSYTYGKYVRSLLLILFSSKIREGGDIGMFITLVPKVLS